MTGDIWFQMQTPVREVKVLRVIFHSTLTFNPFGHVLTLESMLHNCICLSQLKLMKVALHCRILNYFASHLDARGLVCLGGDVRVNDKY